jgi:hypothetical protein
LRASVHYATLLRRAASNKSVTGISKNLGSFSATSDAALETELMDQSVSAECVVSHDTIQCNQLAYQLAEKNGIPHRVGEETTKVGSDY